MQFSPASFHVLLLRFSWFHILVFCRMLCLRAPTVSLLFPSCERRGKFDGSTVLYYQGPSKPDGFFFLGEGGGAFSKLLATTTSLVMYVIPSAFSHKITRLPSGSFSWNFSPKRYDVHLFFVKFDKNNRPFTYTCATACYNRDSLFCIR
jgi:hypothetical protein